MEESSAWRHPVDLISILERAFEHLPAALVQGSARRGSWNGRDRLIPVLLSDDPHGAGTHTHHSLVPFDCGKAVVLNPARE